LKQNFNHNLRKCACRHIEKCGDWRPGVNFTNVLQAAFAQADPKSKKRLATILSFVRFWDLCVYKKLLIERW